MKPRAAKRSVPNSMTTPNNARKTRSDAPSTGAVTQRTARPSKFSVTVVVAERESSTDHLHHLGRHHAPEIARRFKRTLDGLPVTGHRDVERLGDSPCTLEGRRYLAANAFVEWNVAATNQEREP